MPSTTNRSLGELVTELTEEASTLVRHEIALAQLEIGQNVSQLSRNLIMALLGGLVLYTGAIGLLTGGIIYLASSGILNAWQAALAGGGAVAIVGALLLLIGSMALRRFNLVPQHSLNMLHQTATQIKEQVAP